MRDDLIAVRSHPDRVHQNHHHHHHHHHQHPPPLHLDHDSERELSPLLLLLLLQQLVSHLRHRLHLHALLVASRVRVVVLVRLAFHSLLDLPTYAETLSTKQTHARTAALEHADWSARHNVCLEKQNA